MAHLDGSLTAQELCRVLRPGLLEEVLCHPSLALRMVSFAQLYFFYGSCIECARDSDYYKMNGLSTEQPESHC